MHFGAFNVFAVTCILQCITVCVSAGKKEKVHIKIVVPKIIKHHHHTKYVHVPKKVHGHVHVIHKAKKPLIVIHKHDHSHKHKQDHSHKHGHNHGHKHDNKHNHKHAHKVDHKHVHTIKKEEHHTKHEGYGHLPDIPDYHSSYDYDPYLDSGYKRSHKSLKKEKLELTSVKKPYVPNPLHNYVVKSSYQVEETDPYDHTPRSYYEYNYPPIGNLNLEANNAHNKKIPISNDQAEEYEGEQDYQTDDSDENAEKLADYDYSDHYNLATNYLRQDESHLDKYLDKQYAYGA